MDIQKSIFFADHDFADFKKSLDAEGLGSKKRQAEPLSLDEEEILWEKGLLGDKDPHTLLDTMVFCNGLYFALRSGREHRQLRLRPCQIELFEMEGERPYLKYTEDLSKNRPGGIKGRKIKPKVVIHHANSTIPIAVLYDYSRNISICVLLPLMIWMPFTCSLPLNQPKIAGILQGLWDTTH